MHGPCPFNAFVMLKTTFSKHPLIKISIACVYIKPELKKTDATKKTAGTNEDCIGWLLENFDGEGMTLLIAEDVNRIY